METNRFYTDNVLNLGHRGAGGSAPENTLPAFRLAAEMGADGVELDVQLSSDGEAVVIHDFQVDKTTNGHGPVKQKTLAELKSLDAGSHFSPDFAGAAIPTLQEVFTNLGPVLLFNIELKTMSLRGDELEAEVIRLIEDFGLQDSVMVSSYNPFALWRTRRINPRIKRGLLWFPKLPLLLPWRIILRWRILQPLAKPDMFHPHWEAITPAMVQKEHAQNRLVNVWTCNNPADMRHLIAMGVDSIITDHPEILKQVLDETVTT